MKEYIAEETDVSGANVEEEINRSCEVRVVGARAVLRGGACD